MTQETLLIMFSADLNGMGIQRIGNTCICVADSLHCMAGKKI